MSSYFDTMGTCLRDEWALIRLVRTQYRWYLHKLTQEVISKDSGKLGELILEFYRIPLQHEYGPEFVLMQFHDFAHKLKKAQIRLRGKRIASDNPPIPY